MSETDANQAPSSIAIAPRTVEGGQGWTWIAQGWGLFTKNPGIWIVDFILLLVISVVLAVVPLIGHIANQLLMPIFLGGLMLGCRALERGEPFEVAHLFAGFKTNTAQLVMLGLFWLVGGLVIVVFIAVVCFVIGGGALITGIFSGGQVAGGLAGGAVMVMGLIGLLVALLLLIPLTMAIWFAPCLIVFRNLQALDAMKLSFAACMKNVMPFLVYGLLLLVLSIVASIPLALGWLILVPVTLASIYTGYRDIFPET